MKKWIVLAVCLLVFMVRIPGAEASDWQVGDMITGTFSKDTVDMYSLNIEEDTRVIFTLRDNADDNEYSLNTDYNVMLYNQENQSIAAISTYQTDDDQEKTVLPVNLKKGIYVVKVSGTGVDSQGNYAVSYDLGPVKGNDMEPNNDKETANLFNLGDTVDGELNGAVFYGNFDIYKVQVPSFGKLRIELDNTEGSSVGNAIFDMLVSSEKDDYSFTLNSFYGNSNNIEMIVRPGTHYFKIKLGNTSQAVTNYTFSTDFVSLNEDDWESGRNNVFARADLLKNNKTINGFWYDSPVAHSFTHDYFKYTLARDAKVTFIADSFDMLGELTFMDRDGLQFYAEGYSGSQDNGKINASHHLKAGTYYLNYHPVYRHNRTSGYYGYKLTMRIESFKDVPYTHSFYESIEALTQLGINRGYNDGTFHPNESIQRKHVFALLNRVDGLNLPKVRTMKTFKDLPVTHPNYSEVKSFYEAGIIDGSGQYMNPESKLTRGQLAKIFVNTFDLEMKGNGINFTDVKPDDTFYEYIQILASNGITLGSNGRFMPNDPVTRQHFSAFLYRTLEGHK